MRLLFEDFEIDPDGPRLLRGGVEIPLEPRTADLLCYLAANPSRLIRKDELLSQVWHAHSLSDGVLSSAIAKLRKALGQHARARTPIETVHGRGYRFHAPESLQPVALPAAAPEAVAKTEVEPEADRFVGRRPALQQLDECVTRAGRAHGRLVLITGEPGIGKSRTLEELARRARAAGFDAWRGAAYAAGAAPAYWPWVEIVRAALAEAGVRELLPNDCWALNTLVPELFGPARPVDDLDMLRFRVFDELTRLLTAASARRPCLLILDDLHWADTASIELLAQLTRALESRAVLFAAAAREREPERDATHGAALRQLTRVALHVELRGLGPAELSELVRVLGPAEVEGETLERLHELTQGNPFFVQQILQLLAQRGQALNAANLAGSRLSIATRAVIEQRMAGLPEDTRQLLGAAAVLGQSFDATLLARTLDWPLTAALNTLEHTLQAGLVRPRSGAPQRFDFNHVLVRDWLYQKLSLIERGRFHAGAASALAEHSAGADARQLGEIARHSLLALPCDLQACAAHCRRAAHASRDTAAFETASWFLRQAVEQLATPNETSGAEHAHAVLRCELMYELSLDELCAGDVMAAWRALDAGARLAREIGAMDWLARFASRLGSWYEAGASGSDLPGLIAEALARLHESERGLRAILLARQAELRFDLEPAERADMYAESERLAANATLEVLLEVAYARVTQCDPTQLDQARAAVAAYRMLEQRHPMVLPSSVSRLRRPILARTEYWDALIRGDLAAADLAIAECEAAVRAVRVPHAMVLVDVMRCGRALADGRLEDLEVLIEHTRAAAAHFAGSLGVPWMYWSMRLAQARGQLTLSAILNDDTMNTMMSERVAAHQLSAGYAWLATRFAVEGRHDRARVCLQRFSQRDLQRMPHHYGDLGVMCHLVEACCALGDAATGSLLYNRLLPLAALNAIGVSYEYSGSVAHYLGMFDLSFGEPTRARDHLQSAAVFNERLAMWPMLAQTLELLERAKSHLK